MLRIRDVYPGSRIRLFSIPDPNCLHPGSRIPDPGFSSKNLSILTPKKAKKWFLSSKKNMIRVVHPGSRIRMLTFSHPGSRIPDPGVKKHPIPDPGSGSATLIKSFTICTNRGLYFGRKRIFIPPPPSEIYIFSPKKQRDFRATLPTTK
jgi:hypothetical protein